MEFNEELKDIKTYEAGKPIELVVREYGIEPKDVIKLASNENPRGTNPLVVEAIQENAHKAYLYPDDSMYELKNALAARFDVKTKNIIIGAGSDQIIEFALRAKANKQKGILIAKTTFAMYEIYAKQLGAKVFKTPSNEHKLKEFEEIYNKNKNEISVIFLCLPNNPLGECLNKDDVYKFIEKIDRNIMVVVDGAYQEYAIFKDKSKEIVPKDIIEKFPNVLYLGTLSKAYALGGMRCGYGIGNTNIIENLYKLRPPFNITNLTLFGAKEALKDNEFVKKCIEENFQEMKRYEEFAKKHSIDYVESYTNFIIFKFSSNKDSTVISEAMMKEGIIIRNLKSYGINGIRITIGTPEQNTKFFNVFGKIYKNNG